MFIEGISSIFSQLQQDSTFFPGYQPTLQSTDTFKEWWCTFINPHREKAIGQLLMAPYSLDKTDREKSAVKPKTNTPSLQGAGNKQKCIIHGGNLLEPQYIAHADT